MTSLAEEGIYSSTITTIAARKRSLQEDIPYYEPLPFPHTTTMAVYSNDTIVLAADDVSISTRVPSTILLDEAYYSRTQQIVLNWMYRGGSTISLFAGMYIFYWAWRRRNHVYHRIMLVMSMYIILWSPWGMYGAAAIPSGTPGVYGALGTTATCTAQGVFFQLHYAAPVYYLTLSGFSWMVVVYGNFDANRYARIEKYIHFVANLYAIATTAYLYTIEAFNNSDGIMCRVASVPSGCGGDSGIECTRGPQNIRTITAIFIGVPAFLTLVVPTLVMGGLVAFVYIRKRCADREHQQRRDSSGGTGSGSFHHPSYYFGMTTEQVAKQSAVYIGALYVVYAPALVHHSLVAFHTNNINFGVTLVYCLLSSSMGLWYALVYRYFSTSGVSVDGTLMMMGRRASQMSLPSDRKDTAVTARATIVSSMQMAANALQGSNNDDDDDIEESDEIEAQRIQRLEQQETTIRIQNNNQRTQQQQQRIHESSNELSTSSQQKSCEFTFNIFDGTAPTNSPYSDFIFDGEDRKSVV